MSPACRRLAPPLTGGRNILHLLCTPLVGLRDFGCAKVADRMA